MLEAQKIEWPTITEEVISDRSKVVLYIYAVCTYPPEQSTALRGFERRGMPIFSARGGSNVRHARIFSVRVNAHLGLLAHMPCQVLSLVLRKSWSAEHPTLARSLPIEA